MKKYVKISLIYAIAALACGVFYREFTKFNEYTAKTALAVTHLHLFVLGTVLFLIVAVFCMLTDAEKQKTFKPFFIVYNIGLPFLTATFLVRGILQVTGAELSSAVNGMISGIAGISHAVMAAGIVLLFITLLKSKPLKRENGEK